MSLSSCSLATYSSCDRQRALLFLPCFIQNFTILSCSSSFILKANQSSRAPFHPDWGRYPRLGERALGTRGRLDVGEEVPDVGGVAVLGAPTGGVADPLVTADPVLGAEGRGGDTPTSNPS